MQYRPYQSDMVHEIRLALRPVAAGGLGHRSVCVVLPTGGGKTIIFAGMVAGAAAKEKSAWAMAHREELVWQMSDKFSLFGVHHGIIKPGVPETPSLVQACMIQTLKNRMGRYRAPDVVIVDECHHTPSSTYSDLLKLLPATTKIIGFTATPERLDGKGLGAHYDHMIQGPTIQELIGLGFLVPPVVYAPPTVDTSGLHTKMGDYVRSEAVDLCDKPKITGDIIEHYKKLANGLAAVAFCITVEHAEHMAREFNAAGIPSASVDGGMTRDARKATLDAFRDGRIQVLTSCDLISEGFDLPRIECAILVRPTRSLGLYLQQVGRALRPAPGKLRAVILDHVENTLRHGLPDDDRMWFLEGRKSREKKDGDVEIKCKTCPDCYCVYSTRVCPACGSEGEKRDTLDIEHVEGELVLVETKKKSLEKSELELLRASSSKAHFEELCKQFGIATSTGKNLLIARAWTLSDLRTVGTILGYNKDWAVHRYLSRHGAQGLQEALVKEMQDKKESGNVA